jgi:hypothetical protein
MKAFEVWRRVCLDGLGRREEAFALRKQLAEAYPDDVQIHFDYSHALAGRGEVEAAVAHLSKACEAHGPWTAEETARLREGAASIFYENRRLRELLAYVDAWAASKPAMVHSNLFDQYLSALVMLDREQEADAFIETWLAGARGEEPGPIELARLEGALAHALAEGADLRSRWIEEKWLPALVAIARELSRVERRAATAGRIAQDDQFLRTDEGMTFLGELYLGMAKDLETLPPAVLNNLFTWTQRHQPGKDAPSREQVLRGIFTRWEREEDPRGKEILAGIILSRGPVDLRLDLRRKQHAAAKDDEEKAALASEILDLLLSKSWSQGVEEEILGMVRLVGGRDTKLEEQTGAVARIADWLVRSRAAAEIEAIPDRSNKSRRELKPLEEAARLKALEAVTASLRKLEASDLPAELAPFVRIERITVETMRKVEPARLTAEIKDIFLAIPEAPEDEEQAKPMDGRRAILAERCLLVYANLASRPQADAAIGEGLLALLRDAEAPLPAARLPRSRGGAGRDALGLGEGRRGNQGQRLADPVRLRPCRARQACRGGEGLRGDREGR